MALRLSPETALRLPKSVRRPGFDRDRLKTGILHLGVGAFHRCHQAEFTDDALEARPGAWGIRGVNLAPPDLGPSLGEQDGLFCRELRDAGARDRRLVGSMVETLSSTGPEGGAAVRAAGQDPGIRVVTMTVTEKGYCHVPATGELDLANPAIRRDLADPARAASVPGFVVRMLSDRWERGIAPPVLISCDNVPGNGDTLRRCVSDFAARIDGRLAEHIARKAVFLNTMVDRIVPATRAEDRDGFEAATGLRDEALVVGEPFRMWVIEDRGVELPAWDVAGAIVSRDVHAYEILKMRVVNGIQSNLCQLGLMSGVEFMAEVMADPVFAAFAERTIRREVIAHLPPVPGIDLDEYLRTTLRRLGNPDLRHGTAQISTDGSMKIAQRLLEPMRAARRAGTPFGGLALGLAGWIHHVCGRDHAGRAVPVNDPLSEATLAIGGRTTDAGERVRAFLGIREVFGNDLAGDPEVVAALAGFLGEMQRRSPKLVVRDFLAGE